jgi:chromosome segregation protein
LRRALAETLVEEVGRLETSLTTAVRREISGGQAESAELAREQQRRLSGIDAELVAIRSELLETRAELAEARSEAAAAEAARREAEAREARVRAEWERKREAGQAAMEKRQDEARLADRKLAEQARAATEARLLADRDDRDNRLTTALRSLLTLAEALRTNVDALVKHEAQRPSRKDLEAASAEAINAIARVEQATAGVMARVEEGHSRSRTLEGRLTALVEGSQGASLRLSQLVETTARASQERIDALKSTHHKDATALAKVVEEQGTNMATKLAALEEEFARKKKTWFG